MLLWFFIAPYRIIMTGFSRWEVKTLTNYFSLSVNKETTLANCLFVKQLLQVGNTTAKPWRRARRWCNTLSFYYFTLFSTILWMHVHILYELLQLLDVTWVNKVLYCITHCDALHSSEKLKPRAKKEPQSRENRPGHNSVSW